MNIKLPRFFSKKKSPDKQYFLSGSGYSSFAGSTVTSETAMKVAAYYRGLVYISTQIAKLPYEIKDRKRNVLEDHKVAILMDLAPNEYMSAFDFKVFIIQQAINHGNGYAEIERDIVGNPIGLWPLRSSKVVPRFVEGKLWYQVFDGVSTGQDAFIPAKDMLVLKNFVTDGGYSGIGLVEYASNVLGISLAADNMAGNTFSNGGLPSGVLTFPGELTDEQFKRLKDSWDAQQGGKKTGSTALLEEGMTFTPTSFSPDILQFLESRKFGVLEIARFLGLPPTKLFDGDAATYNNIEHSNLEVATDTLDSWARNLESVSDIKLLNMRRGGLKTHIDLYAVFRGDMNTRSTYFNKMMQNGAYTPNEIRSKEGMPSYEYGDRFFIATNNFTPADRVDEVIDSQIKEKDTKDTTDKDTEAETKLAEAAVAYLTRN